MSKDPAGHDPRRSIELLWRAQAPARRGPKPRLTTDEVVRAAVAIADGEGLEAISMRRVAEAVRLSPMSLYTYVPSKSELLDLMIDQVVGETVEPDASVQGWRAKLAFIACERWRLAQRHPWLLELGAQRPPLGPNIVSRMETALQALDGMGLDALERELVAGLLYNYILGALRNAHDARELARRSGLTDTEWLSIAGPALQAYVDPARYPMVARLGETGRGLGKGSLDPAQVFEFGLARVLDGIEAFIESRARPA